MKNTYFRLFLLAVFIFFSSGLLRAQQTLTQINGWNAYVHLPASYNSTTNTYPTIIFFPGIGEIGTTASKVIQYGPGAYITQGWNGNVTVDGNTIEFIVISLQPPTGYPNEIAINQKLQTIKSLYRVNPNKLYLTGLSHGGWCSTTFVTGDPYGGPYTYASQIAAVVEVQGVRPDDNAPYSNLFDNFATSGGKLLGFEQAFDNRDIPTRVNRMNAKVPNSGIYIQTSFGGGGHCCWSQYYGGQGIQPGNFLLDGVSQNLYQWLARQFRGNINLPVSFSGFSGYRDVNGVKLKWTTVNEVNNAGFEVQRSIDGINFIPLEFVSSQKGNEYEFTYSYIDRSVVGEKLYYRIKQIDIDGKTSFSNTILINGGRPISMNIEGLFPNPASNILNLSIASPEKDKGVLIITDMTGRTMSKKPINLEMGSNTLTIDISRLTTGTYMVRIEPRNNFGAGSINSYSHTFLVK